MSWINALAFIGAFFLALIAGAILYLLLHEGLRSGIQAFRISRHLRQWEERNPQKDGRSPCSPARLFLALWRDELFRWSYDVVIIRGRRFHAVPWAERRYFAREAKEALRSR